MALTKNKFEEEKNMQFATIIPARYASTRFPGKPLAMISGKMMIQRVFEQASKASGLVYVATDDSRIYEAVRSFGGSVVMTSASHRSGTDRCAEAVKEITKETGKEIDVVINIQGDEPFINPVQVELLKSCFDDASVEIATLIREVKEDESLTNSNQVKVVKSLQNNALYFSRSPIPYLRDIPTAEWTKHHTYYKHIGMYAYRTSTLEKLTKLGAGTLEKAESLEQNRWLENGYSIRCAVTLHESVGIDTPADLTLAEEYLKSL